MVWCCFLAKNAYLCIRVSHIRPAPAELPQGRKAARVCGCSGAIYSAYPFFVPIPQQSLATSTVFILPTISIQYLLPITYCSPYNFYLHHTFYIHIILLPAFCPPEWAFSWIEIVFERSVHQDRYFCG